MQDGDPAVSVLSQAKANLANFPFCTVSIKELLWLNDINFFWNPLSFR
jgi:hypothetical protein